MAEEQLRKKLVEQLFQDTSTDGTGDDGSDSGGRLLHHARVFEDERESRGVKDLLKVSFQSRDESSSGGSASGSGANNGGAGAGGSGKDDDDDAANKAKLKQRIICISVKKGTKFRICKIKQERFGSLTMLKTWSIDEVKAVEAIDDCQVNVNLGKAYRWTFDDAKRKTEFLTVLLKLCKKHCKKMPKLTNLNDIDLKSETSATPNTNNAIFSDSDAQNTDVSSPVRITLKSSEIDLDALDERDGEGGSSTDHHFDIDLGQVLSGFKWQASGDAAALEARLLSELQALEAANVHDIIQSEKQAIIVEKNIEQALMELSQINEWLSHYTFLLESMGQDVHQIEMQNKGMQVTTTNQRLLLASVDKLLASLRMPGYALEVLKNEPLDDPDGVRECELAIGKLMGIIQTKFVETGDMTSIKERKAILQSHANTFASRFCDHVRTLLQKQAEIYIQDRNRVSQKGSLKLYAHEVLEQKLFKFRGLFAWLKDLDARAHYDIQMTYVQEMSRPYKRDIQEFFDVLKTQHMQRKIGPEEMDFVFASQAVSVSSAASNAIKSAIRSGTSTLANAGTGGGGVGTGGGSGGGGGGAVGDKSIGIKQKLESWRPYRKKPLKGGGGDSPTAANGEENEDGERTPRSLAMIKNSSLAGSMVSMDLAAEERMSPDEAVGHALLKLVNVMVREQNLMIDLFGIVKSQTSIATSPASKTVDGNNTKDSTDALAVDTDLPPQSPVPELTMSEWQDELNRPREVIKDPKAQKRAQELMENLFEDLREQFLSIIESGLKYDQSYAVGMLVHIEFYMKEYANTAHVFVCNLIDFLQKRTSLILEKFVTDQIKAIEDTKITSRKRSGILPFVRTFPKFADRMETMLSNWDGLSRKTVDKAYSRIIKSIFETLEAMAQQSNNESKNTSDDKESLNNHILNVENMHHFYAEVRARKVSGLEMFVKQAKMLYDVNLEAYCKVVIRKPLGKLLEFFEGVEGLLKTGPAEEVSYHVQYSKAALKDVIHKYPSKEVKKGLEALYKRVDKHFTEEAGLHQVVWRGIQEEFTRQLRRYEELIAKCYPEVSIRLDFTMDELLGFFSELALAR